MPTLSSNTNSRSLTEIEAKCEALHKKWEEEDWALEAKITAKQKQTKEERAAEEKRAAKEKKHKEAQRKAKLEKRARILMEKRRQEAAAKARRK